MSDVLDLDAIEARARHWDHLVRDDPDTTLALVAELRRLSSRSENEVAAELSDEAMLAELVIRGRLKVEITT